MLRSRFLVLFFLFTTAASAPAFASEPRLLVLGVWPNEVRLLDETTFDTVARLRLRHGVAVMDSAGYARTAHTEDYGKIYLVTDRMESVETVDLARREVVDAVRLSEPGRRIRIFSAVPSPNGGRLFIVTRPVTSEVDRILPDGGPEIFVYDTATRRVVTSFPMPEAVRYPEIPDAIAATDENTLFVIGSALYAIDVRTGVSEVAFDFARQRAPGYGAAPPGLSPFLCETEPFIYHAVYPAREPTLDRQLASVLRLDLRTRRASSFDVAPWRNYEQVAVAPDGTMAYLGGKDLASVDLEGHRLVKHVEQIERGRTNNKWIVSYDGKKLYVLGVGDQIKIYDTETLELAETVDLGADIMFAPIAVPRSVLGPRPPAN